MLLLPYVAQLHPTGILPSLLAIAAPTPHRPPDSLLFWPFFLSSARGDGDNFQASIIEKKKHHLAQNRSDATAVCPTLKCSAKLERLTKRQALLGVRIPSIVGVCETARRSMAMSTPAALREQSTSSRFAAVVAVCLLLVFGTYVLSSPSDDGETTENNFFNIWHHKSSTWSNKKACGSGDDLEAALCSAADANKTVILSVVNEAFAEEDGLLDLFLESLREGEGTSQLIRHVLLVATDLPAFRRCRSLGLVRCYHLPPVNGSDFSSEQLFMSDGFIRLMWQRIRLLGDVLRHGYSFVFTDLDVIWLRNPFAMMNYSAGEEDFLISSDNFNGRPLDLTNELNSGFFFVAPNNRTVALFDEWYGSWNGTAGLKEQDVLNLMKWGGAFGRLGVRTRVLDTVRFSCFCQDSKDGRQVTTVHANCCRTMRAKVDDLKAVLDVFKRLNGASNVTWPVHTACHRSWMPMPSEKTKN